jgi:hypothetical protein
VGSKNNNSTGERCRARFMLVDFDGSSQDLQQIALTFAHAVKATQPAAGGPAAMASAHEVTPVRVPKNTDTPSEVVGAISPEADVPDLGMAVALTKPHNGAKRKYRTPSVVSELEFNDGSKSLKAYIDEQAPKDHSKRYLAIAQWLKVYRNILEVGADHVYSCYRFLGLMVPDNVLSVFHGLKKQAWVEAGSSRGFFKITHIGENQLTGGKPKE